MSSRTLGTGALPSPMRKREILYDPETPVEELISLGIAFRDADQPMDALDFFVQARSTKHLTSLLEQAIRSGDLFVYEKCLRGLEHESSEEELHALSREADAAGLSAFAARAREDGPAPAEERRNDGAEGDQTPRKGVKGKDDRAGRG